MASSTEIAALAVSLTLNSNNFSKQMSAINQAIKNVDKDFKSAGQGVQGFENTISGLGQKLTATQQKIELYNQKLAAQQQAYERLNSVFQTQNSRLQEIESTLGRGSQEWQNQAQLVQRNAQQLTNLDTAMNQTRGSIANLNSVMSQTDSELTRMQEAANNAQSAFTRITQAAQSTASKMKEIGNSMKDFGSNMAITAGAGAAAIAGPLAMAVKTGAEFESQIAAVAAKASDSTKDIKANEAALTAQAEKLAPLAGGASKAAQAMDDLAAKGYKVNQIQAAMKPILDASNASGEDLATTSDTITSALESFGLKTENTTKLLSNTTDVANVLTGAANASAAGMSDLAYTFNYAAAPAHNLGLSVNDLATATAIMANQGIKGEQAGTSLRMAFTRLTKPPKQAADEIKNLGIQIKDSHGNMLPFADIMEQLRVKTAGLSNTQRNAAMAAIFGAQAYSSLIPLVNAGSAGFTKMSDNIKKSGNAAEQAKIMQDNFAGSLKKLKGSLDAAQISIEQSLAPILRVLADNLSKLIEGFNKLDPHTRQFIVIGAAVAAVVLAIVSALGTFIFLLGNVISGVGTLIGWATKLIPLFEGVAGAIGAITAPAWIAIAAVVAIGVAAYEIITHWTAVHAFLDSLGAWFVSAWKSIEKNTTEFLNNVGQWFSKTWSDIKANTSKAVGEIGKAATDGWNNMKSSAANAWDSMRNAIVGAWNSLKSSVSSGINSLRSAMDSAWNGIKGAAISIWSGIEGGVIAAVNRLRGGITGVISGIRGAISSAWSGIESILTRPFEAARNTINSIIGGIKSTVGGIKSALSRLLVAPDGGPTFVAPPAPTAMSSLASAQGPVGVMATSGSIMDSVSDLSTSIGSTDYSGGLYSSNANVLQATASTKADTQAMIVGLQSQNKNLATQNDLLMQMVNLLQAGQQIAVNVDGKQVALATSSYMDNALRKNRDSKSRARGGK